MSEQERDTTEDDRERPMAEAWEALGAALALAWEALVAPLALAFVAPLARAEEQLCDMRRTLSSALEQTPEPLPLDPEPWLCTSPCCGAPGFHREASLDFLREGRTFKPRDGYEQDRARYDKETDCGCPNRKEP